MSMTNEEIKANKDEFIGLINEISREFDKKVLIDFLENSDFFVAPASTRFHGSYKGGLVDHCLCVYHNLCSLVKLKGFENTFTKDNLIIAALFHDLSKINLYETTYKNVKVYNENGDKYDENGKFSWQSVASYKVRELEDRFTFGTHEETAEFLARKFIPLTLEESVAIINHHGGMGWDSSKALPSDVFDKYPLAVLLHLADMLAADIDKA